MIDKKRIRSFAAGLFAGGVILFLFNLSDLFQLRFTTGILASLLLIIGGGAYLYWEYQKDPQAYIKAHDAIKVERNNRKKNKNTRR